MVTKIEPELCIQYSWIYDSMIHGWQGKKYKWFLPEGLRYRSRLQKEWDKIERKVFDSMSKVSGLKWQKPIIDCYVVKIPTYPFSMPMTLSIRKDLNIQMETIVHELVHNLIVQNLERVKDKDYSKKYGKISDNTNLHILAHAILNETLLKVFGEKKTKEFIKDYSLPDYKKAWDIVEREGPKKIIKDCIK